MSKFHSTVSRRTFMKGLGIGAAGLGAAAAAAPVFHDLDEVMAAPQSGRKLPWYVKEREYYDLTVEVDWAGKERYDKRNFEGVTDEERNRRIQLQLDFIKENWNVPGMSHKDYAFMAGSGSGAIGAKSQKNWGDAALHYTNSGRAPMQPGGYTWKDLGLARWSATPEENLRMMTGALHFWGAGHVGVVAVDEKSKKTFYANDSKGRDYIFADVEEYYTDADHAAVIPSSARYILTWIVPQSKVTRYTAPNDGTNILGKVGMNIGYSHADIIRNRIGTMVGALGFKAVSNSCGGNNVANGIMAGNGELGRTDYLISLEYGANVRKSDFMLTDLPLSPTKPTDAGMFVFCKTCIKCATYCPAGAIADYVEPTFDIVNPGSNGYGLKSYHIDYVKCHPFRGSPGGVRPGGCGICNGVCPFGKTSEAPIHELSKMAIGITPIFNSFIKTMDDAFGYGEFLDPVEFWDVQAETVGSFIPWQWAKSNTSGGGF